VHSGFATCANNLGAVVREVAATGRQAVITHNGREVAVIISLDDYERVAVSGEAGAGPADDAATERQLASASSTLSRFTKRRSGAATRPETGAPRHTSLPERDLELLRTAGCTLRQTATTEQGSGKLRAAAVGGLVYRQAP
jgi:prevent-host-death family protein